MNQLSARLKEAYANVAREEDYIPVKGEVCVAKYTVDQVTPDEMNYLTRCFTLLCSQELDTRAFKNVFDGLARGSGHTPVSPPRSVLQVCPVTSFVPLFPPALFTGSSVASYTVIVSPGACVYFCS